MFARRNYKRVWFLVAALLLLSVTACAPAAPQPAEATDTIPVEETTAPTQVVEVEEVATPTEVPSTATPEPTEEPTEEPTLEPSPVSTETEALPVDQPVSDESSESLPEGFNAWCLKRGVYDQGTVAVDGTMPSWGQPAVMKNGKPDLVIEVQSCTFVYTFDQPVEPGTKLVIHDTLDAPFVDEELIPTEDNPNMAYAVVSNATLVEAQVWTIDFRVAVEDPAGNEIRSETVSFERGWRPQPCYGGVWPNAATGLCPDLGEAHPWDPWYQYSIHGGYNEGVTTPGPIMDPPWADN